MVGCDDLSFCCRFRNIKTFLDRQNKRRTHLVFCSNPEYMDCDHSIPDKEGSDI